MSDVQPPRVTWAEARTYPYLPYNQQRRCQHDWRYVIGLTGGWPRMCTKCGARAR